MNKISIIIPILNEADTIGRLLSYIIDKSISENIQEILVVDGGSNDGSVVISKKFDKVKIVFSQPGRAKQMNAGAKVAKGTILYFLHSDSFPPKGFDKAIIEQVTKQKLAGCFRLKFDYSHPLLVLSQWFTRFNHISCRGGDQSLFISNDLFKQLDGYDEQYIIYEDNEIVKRLYAVNQFVVLPQKIITSARRYRENGVLSLQYHFVVIHIKYSLGHTMEDIVRYFKKHIK